MNSKKLRKLKEIYAKVPKSPCTGACISCCGSIAMSGGEYKHLMKITRERPQAVNGVCNYLEEGKCKIYADRPLICRLWGSTDDPILKCSHCDGPKISKAEAWKLLEAVQKLMGEPVDKFYSND